MKKMISWNVNGLRACVGKGFLDVFHELDADIFCIQESKLQEGQIDLELPGYYQYWSYAEKKGYSGTALFSKEEPLSVSYGLGIEKHDHEGRVITAEYPDYYVVTCYTPNSQNELARLPYRMQWEDDFRQFLKKLVMIRSICILKQYRVVQVIAHQTGGMVEQHTHSDILVPLVLHREFRYVIHDRLVQLQLSRLTQLLHGRRSIHLADGTNPID